MLRGLGVSRVEEGDFGRVEKGMKTSCLGYKRWDLNKGWNPRLGTWLKSSMRIIIATLLTDFFSPRMFEITAVIGVAADRLVLQTEYRSSLIGHLSCILETQTRAYASQFYNDAMTARGCHIIVDEL